MEQNKLTAKAAQKRIKQTILYCKYFQMHFSIRDIKAINITRKIYLFKVIIVATDYNSIKVEFVLSRSHQFLPLLNPPPHS